MDARRSLLDALDAERKIRTSGVAEEEIHVGRVTQAKGIEGALGNLTASGKQLTADEALAAAKGGAKTGTLRQTFAEPLNLTPENEDQLLREILSSPDSFDKLTALGAFTKLKNGLGLQPKEEKLLRRIYGDEIGDAIAAVNAGRIPTVAQLTDADMEEIARNAVVDGRKAARAEVEAKRQHELADRLQSEARMNPTNKRLAKAVDDARARALKLETDSERFQVERIEKLEAKAKAKTERAEVVANRREVQLAEARDKAIAAQEAKVVRKGEDEWIRGLEDAQPDEFAQRMNRLATADEKRLAQQQDRALVTQTDRRATTDYKASGAKALDKALAAIDKADLPDSVKATAKEAVEQWVKADGAILDSMKGDAPGFLRTVYAGAVGEVSDSWTSAMLEQRAFMRGVLQNMGFDSKSADSISKALSDMEVARRWGPEPPDHITKSLDQAKRKFGAADNAITGMAAISQEFKNLMFGIADVGIFGIQGLAAGAQGLAPVMVGTANRLLHVARLGVDTSPGNLAKRVQFGLDGRIRGGATYTGVVDPDAGTLLRHIPGMKTVDQKYISRAIGSLTDLQFRHVMGFLGDLVHEGQLVMLKLSGSDITDPLVRKQSAEFANAISSAGKLSQRAGRGNVERAFILSPSMIRSQAQIIGKIGRLLGPTTTRENRIMAASILVSYGATLAAIGKYVNDMVGTEDFEFDPSKPGAWQIRLESGHIITPFPQTQLARLLIRSGRVIAEEGKGDQDAKMIGRGWLNFGLGRLSPAAAIGTSAAGVGFDPDRGGWAYGDLNEGKSWWEQVRDNILPTPPSIDSAFREGLDPVGTPMEAIGLSNFRESEWSAREREIKADPRFQGRGWNELEEHEKAIVNAEQGRVYSRKPEIRAQQERADVIAGDAKAYQEKIDEWLLRGEKPDGTPYTVKDWDLDRTKNDRFVAGRYEELYRGVDWKKDDLNPVDRYYKAIADAVNPQTDEVDWDKVDAFEASLSKEDRDYLDRNTNLRDTVLEQQRRQDVKMLGDSGYFDAKNKVAVRKADPEIAAAVRRWGFSDMSVKAEDTVMRYTYQQEQDDKAYEAGEIDIDEWNDRTNTRRDQLRGAKDSIYEGVKDDGVSTEPLDRYFDQVKLAKGANGQTDYQKVDAWVAQQPPEDQEVINAYVSPGLTPMVGAKNAAVKAIVDSGYWDINDRVTEKWAEAKGFDYPEGMDADKFWGGIEMAVLERIRAKGLSDLEARSLTNVVMGQLQKDYVDISGKVRSALRDADPELARRLIQWGYWEPGKKDTGELIAAGTLR